MFVQLFSFALVGFVILWLYVLVAACYPENNDSQMLQ
jgi:hypothetical protein